MSSKEEAPSVKALEEGYNQTYLIMSNPNSSHSNDEKQSSLDTNKDDDHEVFFRCGNWCYKGQIQFGGLALKTEEIPVLIPLLQKQQGSLRYYCNAKSVPSNSDYSKPLSFLEECCEFIASELISESIDKELRKMSNIFPWIDDNNSITYFELTLGNIPLYMNKVSIIASKTYTRGLIIISIYYDGIIYFILQNGEGDQPLLDVRFPDVSEHGQGVHINTYNDHTVCYRKLTLWHVLFTNKVLKLREVPKIKTINVSSKNYQQTYCILKSSWDPNSAQLTVHHDVLFRFGSWCYCGRVQLTPALTLADIPYLIPALRMQQSRLDYLCDVAQVPTTSPFAESLHYVQHITPLLEYHIIESEITLKELILRLSDMGLGESVMKWLEGDPINSFFEFKIAADLEYDQKFKNVELIVSKTYHASGIITIMIIFQNTIYVSILENDGESPLLDSRFPDVSGKGRGYQLQSYSSGVENWKNLRKVSIWQTIGALEQEFKDKAQLLAQSKRQEDNNNPNSNDKCSSQFDDIDIEEEEASSFKAITNEISAKATISHPNNPESEVHIVQESYINHNNNGGLVNNNTNAIQNYAEDKYNDSPSNRSYNNIDNNNDSNNKVSSENTTDNNFNYTTTTTNNNNNNNNNNNSNTNNTYFIPRRESALPHHVPKVESLSSKMEDLRKTMGSEGLKAPWDAKGKPLGAIGSGLKNNLTPLGSIPSNKDAKK